MASKAHVHPSPDTLIVVKVAVDGVNRKFRFPLKLLNAANLPAQIRQALDVKPEANVLIERWSDSAATFVTLDSGSLSAWKQLYRAAKAKLKLRLKVTVVQPPSTDIPGSFPTSEIPQPMQVDAPESNDEPLLPTVLQPQPTEHDMLSAVATANAFSGLGHELNDLVPGSNTRWQIFCNHCDKVLESTHYHCDVCDSGDFDICAACKADGKMCRSDDHWLIKRKTVDGKVVRSTTHTVSPKPKIAVSTTAPPVPVETRTCNGCVRVFTTDMFVTCQCCADYDLCSPCLVAGKHGHNPAHHFEAAVADSFFSNEVLAMCKPGRTLRHFAVCDGCDKSIVGVRHKCLECPDFDYCGECFTSSGIHHGRHRFVPIYEALATPRHVRRSAHYGVFCDGPLCTSKGHQTHIEGVRFKCAICHDTDFCANCEAHPSNKHNITHPLIKFKTPVRGASVKTMVDEEQQAVGDIGAMPEPVQAMPTIDAFDATLVSMSIEEGKTLGPDEEFTQSWTLRNTGRAAWPVGCCIELTGGDDMLLLSRVKAPGWAELREASQTTYTNSLIEVGACATFSVRLRARTREGKNMSFWRLKTPNGISFGCSLWCDINVHHGDYSTGAGLPSFELRPEALVAALKPLADRGWARHAHTPSIADQPFEERARMITQRIDSSMQALRDMPDASAAASKAWRAPIKHESPPARLSMATMLGNADGREATDRFRSFMAEYRARNGQKQESSNNRAADAQLSSQGCSSVRSSPGLQRNGLSTITSPSQAAPQFEHPSAGALADYELQLKLLEDENKRRITKARAEQDAMIAAAIADKNRQALIAKAMAESAAEQPAVTAVDEPVNPFKDMASQIQHAVSTDSGVTFKAAHVEGDEEMANSSSSEMVFPKLDKESPASSTHLQTDLMASTPSTQEFVDAETSNVLGERVELLEEFEEVLDEPTADHDLDGMDQSDDSDFDTDEYDILDASDEEIVAAGRQS